jgi:hypothetical protein
MRTLLCFRSPGRTQREAQPDGWNHGLVEDFGDALGPSGDLRDGFEHERNFFAVARDAQIGQVGA